MPKWRTAVFPWFAAPLALLLRLYWRLVRLRMSGVENVEPLLMNGTRFIPCCWHQRQVFALCALRRLRSRGVNPGALVSPSKDGELAARLLAKLEITAVRGSGRRSGAMAMRDMYVAIKDQDLSPLIAPGLNSWAGPVVPLSFSCTRGVKLGTWDRLLLPLPFSRVEVVFGEPIELAPLMQMSESPETIERMGAALTAVEDAAIARARH